MYTVIGKIPEGKKAPRPGKESLMPYISSLRHAWPEKAGFTIVRKNGHPLYTFLHFYGSVELP